MGRGRVFEIEQLYLIGRGIDLPRKEMRIRRNNDAAFRQIVRAPARLAIAASTRHSVCPRSPPQALQSSADSNGLFSVVLPWAQKSTQSGEISLPGPSYARLLEGQDLLVQCETGAGDAFFLARGRARRLDNYHRSSSKDRPVFCSLDRSTARAASLKRFHWRITRPRPAVATFDQFRLSTHEPCRLPAGHADFSRSGARCSERPPISSVSAGASLSTVKMVAIGE